MKQFSSLRKELVEHRYQVNESSAFGKGYVVGQQARFNSVKAKFLSTVSELERTSNAGRTEKLIDEKLDKIFEANAVLADALRLHCELLTHIM